MDPVVDRMLTKQQLRRHLPFLHAVYKASPERCLSLLKEASYFELRALLGALATVLLKKVPCSQKVISRLQQSRKKSLLRTVFRSKAAFRRFVATRNKQDGWRVFLRRVGNLLPTLLSCHFKASSS